MKYLPELIFLVTQLSFFNAVARPTFGSISPLTTVANHFNIAHLFPFQGAGAAIGGDAVNAAVCKCVTNVSQKCNLATIN